MTILGKINHTTPSPWKSCLRSILQIVARPDPPLSAPDGEADGHAGTKGSVKITKNRESQMSLY
jgi:hypothetical protein